MFPKDKKPPDAPEVFCLGMENFSVLQKLLRPDRPASQSASERQRPDPDPVIEAYKRDVDQTLLVENLRKTPELRMATLVAMAKASAEMSRARRAAARKR
jgi:hypothetical protein